MHPELRPDYDVMQRFGGDDFGIRHAGDGRGIESVHLGDAEEAITLGNKHLAVGHEG